MKISKKFNDFIYFTFSFINSLKKLLHFHFRFMITSLVTCLIINIFWNFSKWEILKIEIECFYYYWLYL